MSPTAVTNHSSNTPTAPEPVLSRTSSRFLDLLGRPGAGVVAFLAILLIALEVAVPVFLSPGNVYVIVNQAVFVVLPTLGMTLVIIAGGIDLSVGSTLGLCGGVAAALLRSGAPMPIAFGAALAAGAVVGFINGLTIVRLGIPDFIATLAMLGVARGVLYVWTQGVPILDYASDSYQTIGGLTPILWPLTIPLAVALACLLVATFVLKRTRIGIHLRATGSSADAAILSGVATRRIKLLTYVVSGVLAAATGILLAGRLTTVHPDMGAGYELQAVAAAVMGGAVLKGGRGSFWGALTGAVTLTVIQNAINILDLDSNWEDVVVGVIILAAVLLDRGAVKLSARRT